MPLVARAATTAVISPLTQPLCMYRVCVDVMRGLAGINSIVVSSDKERLHWRLRVALLVGTSTSYEVRSRVE